MGITDAIKISRSALSALEKVNIAVLLQRLDVNWARRSRERRERFRSHIIGIVALLPPGGPACVFSLQLVKPPVSPNTLPFRNPVCEPAGRTGVDQSCSHRCELNGVLFFAPAATQPCPKLRHCSRPTASGLRHGQWRGPAETWGRSPIHPAPQPCYPGPS
jgi:hypothetical protein